MDAKIEDLLLERWLRKRNSGELRWKLSEDRSISVKDMSDKHLDNAINYLLGEDYDETDMWSIINGY